MSTAISSSEQFFEQAKKLDLLQGSALDKARAALDNEQEPQAIARKLIRAGLISRWAASQFLKGRTLRWGKYQLIDQIGKEVNSPIYLAEHTQMERRVVLKVLTESQAGRSELRAVAQLDHRNLVHIFDIDHQNDKYYLVMEYVEGVDLQQVVADGTRPPFEDSAAYILQAALGLAHAHERGIVHRQIQPRNVMVDHEGVVKILNLDAARPVKLLDEAGSKVEQLPAELIDYLSPEQAAGKSKIDSRSDVYSLGCIFYHLLTGHPPFASETIAARLKAHINDTPRPISELAPDVPESLATICERMIAKSLPDRYQETSEIVADLDAWLVEYEQSRKASAPKRRPPVADVTGIEAAGTSPLDRVKPANRPGVLASMTPRQKLIAACAAGGAALLLVVGIVVAAIFSGDEKSVAEQDPSAAPGTNLDASGIPTGETPSADPRSAKKTPLDGGFPEPGALTEEGKQPASENVPAKGTSGQLPAENTNGENVPKTPPEVKNPPTEVKPPAEVKPREPPVKPPVKPPATEVPTPKPKPPKPAQPKPEEPKKAEYFKDFPKSISLPVISSAEGAAFPAEPVAIGSLKLAEEAEMYVSLLGGDVAVRGGTQFMSRSMPGNDPKRAWQFLAVHADGAEVAVADLKVANGELLFQWLPTAAGESSSNYLRNCFVSLQADSASHNLALREAVKIDPLAVDLQKPRFRASHDLDWLPVDEVIMVEITKLDGKFPTAAWDPGQVMAADGGQAQLLLGENADRVLSFQIRSELRRGVQLDFASFFKIDSENAPLPFTKAVAEKSGTKVVNAQAEIAKQIADIQGVKDKKKKKALVPKLNFLKEQKTIADRALAQLNSLRQLYNDLNESGTIHYRVYFQSGTGTVVLATTEE